MSFLNPHAPVMAGSSLQKPQHSLPSTIEIHNVHLPKPAQVHPSLQPCEFTQTDRLVKAVEDVFFDHAFCLQPGVVRSTTVMVNEFADGRTAFGMLQVQPDQIKTMGHTFNPHDHGITGASVVAQLHSTFLAMADQAQVSSLPALTIDTSILGDN